MTTPRIGDTVHYYGAYNGGWIECHRATVQAPSGEDLHLRCAYNDALGHFQTVAEADPSGTTPPTEGTPTAEFTPGTWHHIH